MDDADCLDPETLAAFVDGALSGAPLARAETHLVSCGGCRDRWGALASEGGAVASAGGSLRLVGSRRAVWRQVPTIVAGACAASAVAAGVWLVLRLPGQDPAATLQREPVRAMEIPEGRLLAGPEAIQVAPGEPPLAVRLSDGSRFQVRAGSAVRFEASGGAQALFHLERGWIEGDVARRPGEVRFRAEAGEIRVLGTRFRVKAVRLHEKGKAEPLLAVEVLSGSVSLETAAGAVVVPSGRRGIARKTLRPLLQEVQWDLPWRSALRKWGNQPGVRDMRAWPFATLAVGCWSGADDWLDALATEEATGPDRVLAARLAAATAEESDRDRLQAVFAREPDGAVRSALAEALARFSGPFSERR